MIRYIDARSRNIISLLLYRWSSWLCRLWSHGITWPGGSRVTQLVSWMTNSVTSSKLKEHVFLSPMTRPGCHLLKYLRLLFWSYDNLSWRTPWSSFQFVCRFKNMIFIYDPIIELHAEYHSNCAFTINLVQKPRCLLCHWRNNKISVRDVIIKRFLRSIQYTLPHDL